MYIVYTTSVSRYWHSSLLPQYCTGLRQQLTGSAQVLTTAPKISIVGNIKGSVIMMAVKYTTIKTAAINNY